MYSKPFGRLPAGQARHHTDHSKRQIDANGRLTAPITFTITTVRPAVPSVVTVTTTRGAQSSSSSSPASSVVAVSTTLLSSPTSSSASVNGPTSNPVSIAAPSGTTSVANPSTDSATPRVMDTSPDSGERQKGLPPGAIAGTVIAILLIIVALAVFLVRRRSILGRQKRSRSWKDNMFSRGGEKHTSGGGGMGSMSEAALASSNAGNTGYGFAASNQRSSPVKAVPRVPVPATPTSTYNNLPPSGGLPTPRTVGSPQSTIMPVNGATVVSTFIPSLPDELSISMGEIVRVLAEYDDGWALCANTRAEQGMVPLECLSQGSNAQQVYVARDPSLARRGSSLIGSGSVRRG